MQSKNKPEAKKEDRFDYLNFAADNSEDESKKNEDDNDDFDWNSPANKDKVAAQKEENEKKELFDPMKKEDTINTNQNKSSLKPIEHSKE